MIISRIKKLYIVVLNIIMCMASFAAVVSDNDGAAFITKAEFDSLKNDFQQELVSNNSSLDNKIQSVIASYIEGVKNQKTEVINPIVSNYKDIRWMHGPYMYFTKRHFNEYTTTAGRYTDTTGWQIINPENRRQTINDGYSWFYDHWSGSFSSATLAMMLYPYNVGAGWGTGRKNVVSARGPSIFAVAENTDGKWVVSKKNGGFVGEQGHQDHFYGRLHVPGISTGSNRGADNITGINTGLRILYDDANTDLEVTNITKVDDDLIAINIENVKCINSSKSSQNITISNHMRQSWNPALVTSKFCNLWSDGSDGFGLKTACGWEGNMGSFFNRVAGELVEDNRWKTETQFNKDMDNFIYAMWGSDVYGTMNIAPPVKEAGEGYYIDLSSSPNLVPINFYVITVSITGVAPHPPTNNNLKYDNNLGAAQSTGRVDWNSIDADGHPPVHGSIVFNMPLFYRATWSQICSGDFKNSDGNAIAKGDGYPIIINSKNTGTLKLKIKYEETSDTDTSYVTLTPDNKVKSYFKNKPFNDLTGSYVRGYTNYDGTGTQVTLNGTEWTGKEINTNIKINAGDSLWMRIDPLTSDGVYCKMTDWKCEFVSE